MSDAVADATPSVPAPSAAVERATAGGDLSRRTFRIWFAVICASALVFRLLYVVGAKRNDEALGDQLHYFAQAAIIADGRWFEHPWVPDTYSALHAPLTALALAPVSWVDENLIFTQRLTMAVYGTLVVVGLGYLARILFSRWTTLVCTAIAAFYANLWMNDGLIMSETFAAGGVVAVLIAVYHYHRRPSPLWAALAGVAVGFAGLARSELLLLGPVVVAPMMVWPPRWRVGWKHLLIAGALSVAVIAPWVIRNQIRFDEPTFMSTNDGLTLLGANCAPAYEGPGIGFWVIQCADLVDVPPDADESIRSMLYREEAIEFIGDNVDRIPTVIAARLARAFSVWRVEEMIDFNVFEGRESWASRIGLWQYWLMVPLAGYGLWRWPSSSPRWPLVATVGLTVFVVIAFYGIVRFRIPAEIALVLCAGAGATGAVSRLTEWRRTRHTHP